MSKEKEKEKIVIVRGIGDVRVRYSSHPYVVRRISHKEEKGGK